MHKASFKVTKPGSDEKDSVTAEFSEDEVECLRAYSRYVDELIAVKLVQDGVPCSVKLDYKEGEGTTVTSELPPDEDVVVLLHRLRPLILNNEHASFNRVTGILGKRIGEPLVRGAVKSQREIYDGRAMQRQIVVRSMAKDVEIIINSEKALFVWLNAYEYHRDQNKKREIDRYHQLMPLDHSKAFFLMLLSDKIRAIAAIARFVNIILGKGETARL
jgi:hypothetical protein